MGKKTTWRRWRAEAPIHTSVDSALLPPSHPPPLCQSDPGLLGRVCVVCVCVWKHPFSVSLSHPIRSCPSVSSCSPGPGADQDAQCSSSRPLCKAFSTTCHPTAPTPYATLEAEEGRSKGDDPSQVSPSLPHQRLTMLLPPPRLCPHQPQQAGRQLACCCCHPECHPASLSHSGQRCSPASLPAEPTHQGLWLLRRVPQPSTRLRQGRSTERWRRLPRLA